VIAETSPAVIVTAVTVALSDMRILDAPETFLAQTCVKIANAMLFTF
jgi:uncharacterized lipoprotein YbaY